MTDHHHPESQVPERDRPTPRQLRLLRSLALQTGQSFATPRTKTQASQEIRRLQRASRGGERQTPTASDVSDRLPNAAAYRNHEVTGYGITARWA
jgi:hypothetical protein